MIFIALLQGMIDAAMELQGRKVGPALEKASIDAASDLAKHAATINERGVQAELKSFMPIPLAKPLSLGVDAAGARRRA